MATLTLIYGNGDTVTYGNDDVAVVVSNPTPVRKGIAGGKMFVESNADKGILGGTILTSYEEPSRLSWFRTIIVNGRIYTEDFSNRTVTVGGAVFEEWAQDEAAPSTPTVLPNDLTQAQLIDNVTLTRKRMVIHNPIS